MLAEALLQAPPPVAAQHGPQLERPEAPSERNRDLAEVERVVGRAQVLGDEAERVAEVLLPPRPEHGAVHRDAQPLVRVHADRVGALPAGEVVAAAPAGSPPTPRRRRRRGATSRPQRSAPRSPARDRREVMPVVPIVARTRHASSSPSSSGRIRNASSVGTFRSSRPSSRAAFSPTECACSEQTRTRRSGRSERATIAAVSTPVEAVSSMWPRELLREARRAAAASRPSAPRAPGAPGEVRQRIPTWLSPAIEQLREDARLGPGRREVREEAWALPVREPRQRASLSRSSSTAENGSGSVGGRGRQAARIAPGSTCDSTGSSPTRSRYDATHSSASAPSSRKSLTSRASFDVAPGARVQHLLLREPRTPRLRDAELRVAEGADRVRIGRDRDPDACLAREPGVRVAHVEPVGLRVDLERRPRLDGVRDDTLDVDRSAVALQQPSTREVPDAVDVRVVHRAEDPLGRAAVERRVERRDHPVELGERVVVHVERAVGADVHLDPAEHAERRQPRVELSRSPSTGPRAARRAGSASGR